MISIDVKAEKNKSAESYFLISGYWSQDLDGKPDLSPPGGHKPAFNFQVGPEWRCDVRDAASQWFAAASFKGRGEGGGLQQTWPPLPKIYEPSRRDCQIGTGARAEVSVNHILDV